MKKFLYVIFVFIFIGCGGENNTNNKSGIIIPAYFYDANLWDEVVNADSLNKFIVIINPNYGPGDNTDDFYSSVINDLITENKTPIGYVYTKWGSRDISEVENDIDKWLNLYPSIKGFFIDEANSTADGVTYYKTLYSYIKAKGNYFVVLNPGTTPNTEYFNVSDLVVVFENDVSKLNNNVCENNFEKSAVIVYGADEEDMKEFKNVCGYVYFTDDSGNNPYDSLPSYFYEEINELK
jgi:hypothetical protein